MKQIKAFIHPHRINTVTEALRNSGLCDITNGGGCHNVTVSNVQRLFTSTEPNQQRYSVELAEAVIAEAKLELICDDALAPQLVALIRQAGKPGTGWIYTTDIQAATTIG
jgi:nitrogen regulatory protein PII